MKRLANYLRFFPDLKRKEDERKERKNTDTTRRKKQKKEERSYMRLKNSNFN